MVVVEEEEEEEEEKESLGGGGGGKKTFATADNEWQKVGKHNALSGNITPGRSWPSMR